MEMSPQWVADADGNVDAHNDGTSGSVVVASDLVLVATVGFVGSADLRQAQ